jgi:hypothetical protein
MNEKELHNPIEAQFNPMRIVKIIRSSGPGRIRTNDPRHVKALLLI